MAGGAGAGWGLAAQAGALGAGAAANGARGAVALGGALLRAALRGGRAGAPGGAGAVFFEGWVFHSRRSPARHSFRLPLRLALVDLDAPPDWWDGRGHFTAAQARAFAGTDGDVRLLTNPRAAGFVENPISVYYLYDGASGALVSAIAEVTNTPWGERVRFGFHPGGDVVPKSLHVSPFMDMKGRWAMRSTDPLRGSLELRVAVRHPEHGDDFFLAEYRAETSRLPHHRSEDGDLAMVWRFGLMPHRVAIWIYWHAVLLLRKGVGLFAPPAKDYKAEKRAAFQGRVSAAAAEERPGGSPCPAAATSTPGVPVESGYQRIDWCPAQGFPWKTALS